MRPPMRSRASMRATRRPAALSFCAAMRPETPAPMMATSKVLRVRMRRGRTMTQGRWARGIRGDAAHARRLNARLRRVYAAALLVLLAAAARARIVSPHLVLLVDDRLHRRGFAGLLRLRFA